MPKHPVLASGKTKNIYDLGHGQVLVESRDDITAGDGAAHDLLPGKGRYSTLTTVNCFQLLVNHGLATHFLAPATPTAFVARRVQMIPLEIVIRRRAAGSYLKRWPQTPVGTSFSELIVELYLKDDHNHDPLVIINRTGESYRCYAANQPLKDGFLSEQPLPGSPLAMLTSELVRQMTDLAKQAFLILEQAWAGRNVALVDLKLECGFDAETGQLVIADVIDNDSWRIWPDGDPNFDKSKQVYRNLVARTFDLVARKLALDAIADNYAWVARATNAFL